MVDRLAALRLPATDSASTPVTAPGENGNYKLEPGNGSRPENKESEESLALFRRWSMGELLTEPDDFSWLVGGLFAAPTYGQIAGEMKTLKSSLDRFRVYELAVALEFPDSVALANNNGSCALPPCLKIETWLKKSGTVDWAPTEGRVAPDPEFSNLVSVHVAGANSGDRVRFKGSLADASRTWRSEKEIEIPLFHVDMKEPR